MIDSPFLWYPLVIIIAAGLGAVITWFALRRGLRQTEKALRESENKFRIFTNSLPETVWEADLKGNLTYGNQAGLDKFGYTQEDLDAGLNLFSCITPEFREPLRSSFINVIKGGSSPTGAEYMGLRKDGSTFPLVISAVVVMRNGVPVRMMGLLVDMTARRKVEDLLIEQHRTAAILEVHENLAREVAEVLHGRVQNKLLMALRQIDECMQSSQKDSPDITATLTEVQKLIEDVREKEIRAASHRLHPSIIDLGLVPAIRSLADAFEDDLHISLAIDDSLIKLDDPVQNRIPTAVRLAVYRILEETFSNAFRHGKARDAKVSVSVDSRNRLALIVEDNGCGFEPGTAKQGLGLKVIAGRAQSVGGTAVITSSPGKGAKIEVSIPLAA